MCLHVNMQRLVHFLNSVNCGLDRGSSMHTMRPVCHPLAISNQNHLNFVCRVSEGKSAVLKQTCAHFETRLKLATVVDLDPCVKNPMRTYLETAPKDPMVMTPS